jgi:tetratricopeptide (TPR) repeat protein
VIASPKPKTQRPKGLPAVLLAAVLLAHGCASTRVSVRDAFPLDPREGLPGPFSGGVERGWKALAKGDAQRALAEFSAERSDEKENRAAGIGLIEAQVLAGWAGEAAEACAEALDASDATLPLLVACGEVAAADGKLRDGWMLYRRALARTSGRPGLQARADALRKTAADELTSAARAAAEADRPEEARRLIDEAVDLTPESAGRRAAAAEIALAGEDRQRALARYREAVEIDPADTAIASKTGELALEEGEDGLAVAIFDALSRRDPAFAQRADEARLEFRAANWPELEREAARSQKLTRAGAASLVWWMAPEVREAVVTSSVIASDAVSRRDSRALTRALALGLLETDRETHRSNPDGVLTTGAAARMLVRLLGILEPRADKIPCRKVAGRLPKSGSEAAQVARGCGLIDGRDSAAVSGPAFVRAVDRVRALAAAAPGGE